MSSRVSLSLIFAVIMFRNSSKSIDPDPSCKHRVLCTPWRGTSLIHDSEMRSQSARRFAYPRDDSDHPPVGMMIVAQNDEVIEGKGFQIFMPEGLV